MKRRTSIKYLAAGMVLILSLLLVNTSTFAKNIHHDYTMKELKEIAENAVSWREQAQKNYLRKAGTTSSDWYIIALGGLGMAADYEDYLAVMRDRVQKRYRMEEKLDANKATEWHRIALAILAAGGDPQNAGTDEECNPINLIADGIYDRGRTVPLDTQGINGYTWGLLTLDAGHYKVPENAVDTRVSIIQGILSYELPGGGFALSKKDTEPDIDITAMTLQALAPYVGDSRYPGVSSAVTRSLDLLSESQTGDGDFISYGSQNLESTAQVMIALCCLGINPVDDERFIRNGNTVLDGIMKYHQEDGGFLHSYDYDKENPTSNPKESNQMAGEQALLAISALMRYYRGYEGIYDFAKENRKDVLRGAEMVSARIRITEADLAEYEALPEQLTTEHELFLICFLDKLDKAENGADYEYLRPELLQKKQQVEEIEKRMEEINQKMLQELYPYESLGIRDAKKIHEMTKELETLSEYDRSQTAGYEDFLRARKKIVTEERAVAVSAGLAVFVILLTIVWMLHVCKRRKERYEEEHWYEMEQS